jgi:hypothetical protein
MARNDKKVIVYLDPALDEWLSRKALDGFKKASLIRKALHIYMDCDTATEAYCGPGKGNGSAAG